MTAHSPRHWQDLTTADFESLDAGRLIAVLPLGAIEQHGPHLPLSTDRAIADGVLARVIDLLPDEVPAVILPTQPVGLSIEHGAFPGTLTASPGTLLNLWTEIGASVARAGVRKLVLFNSHGGQSKLAGLVAQQLRSEHGLLAKASTAAVSKPRSCSPSNRTRCAARRRKSSSRQRPAAPSRSLGKSRT
jgi:creatinine amidohydrolase